MDWIIDTALTRELLQMRWGFAFDGVGLRRVKAGYDQVLLNGFLQASQQMN